MGDDIHEIETQNRGLQILAQNQQSLISELDHLLVSEECMYYMYETVS